jgi:hypothetical protein
MQQQIEEVIIDSSYSLNEALEGIEVPESIRVELALVDVEYFSFDKKLHRGQIVIHKKLVDDIQKIFMLIKENKFPVEKVIPIVKYNWSDNESMLDNNTSAFNYRLVAGTNRVSNHSYGQAIDINPFQNPHIKNGIYSPKGSKYSVKTSGTIYDNHFIVNEFKKLGWDWGGDWTSPKDYQHFEKKVYGKK